MKNSRIEFMKVPVDFIEEKDLEHHVLYMLENNKTNQIVFLGFPEYLKARTNRKFRTLLEEATLVLPSSSILKGGLKFLFKRESPLFMGYDFILRILSILEKNKKSIYIIGSNRKNILVSEKNLKDSYPGLHLVGRSSSIYSRDTEEDIILAIKKSSPSLLLAGSGLRGKDFWLFNNRMKFNRGITLWSPDCFEIFSGKKKRPSRKASSRFFARFGKSLLKPWRLFYIFPFVYYYLSLLIYKLFIIK